MSIARRLQDPLAELVKIDPKSIGVGQYQHDVPEGALGKKLDEVVESCVNHVGVDVNTASVKLLQYVAGVGETLAKNIVTHRAEKGPFRSRKGLLEVPRITPALVLHCKRHIGVNVKVEREGTIRAGDPVVLEGMS